ITADNRMPISCKVILLLIFASVSFVPAATGISCGTLRLRAAPCRFQSAADPTRTRRRAGMRPLLVSTAGGYRSGWQLFEASRVERTVYDERSEHSTVAREPL